MPTFMQPEIVDREYVVKNGGLLPLTDIEISEISELVKIDSRLITRLPIYRVIGDNSWNPTLFDFLKNSMSVMPESHTRTAMAEFLTLKDVEEYAVGDFTLEHPETGETGRFRLMYPYPDLKWAHTFCE
ncbi:hypothetical protein [Stappia sp. MMSF_3263]|uniref:hypothetical protein n=1 Tax=Stappia sp. MMSF_3263 TaxID=3046693 RepID=UPI00273D886B|nr:hypothetical protein [Stappia sp. MMSF_3263]